MLTPLSVFKALSTLAAMALLLVSCASFLHFSDPTAQKVSCDIAESEMVLITSAAAICGPFQPACLAALEAIFGSACLSAAQAGKTQKESHDAAIAAVQQRSGAMKDALAKAGVSAQSVPCK
jgi:hypothetical protein